MSLWSAYVGGITTLLLALSQAYGGSLGWAIVTFSLLARIALLPLTLRLAVRSRARAQRMLALQPEVKRLERLHKENPGRLAAELNDLYRREGLRVAEPADLLGAAVQAPIVGGLYSAIRQGLVTGGRFLWISNLASPDCVLALVAALLSLAAARLHPDLPGSSRTVLSIVPAVATFWITARLAAGLGLYCAASAAVSVVQSLLLRHRASRPA